MKEGGLFLVFIILVLKVLAISIVKIVFVADFTGVVENGIVNNILTDELSNFEVGVQELGGFLAKFWRDLSFGWAEELEEGWFINLEKDGYYCKMKLKNVS